MKEKNKINTDYDVPYVQQLIWTWSDCFMLHKINLAYERLPLLVLQQCEQNHVVRNNFYFEKAQYLF